MREPYRAVSLETQKEPLSIPQQAQEAMLERVRLSRFFPYLVYDEESEVYLNDDGSLGVIIEIMPKVNASSSTMSTLENMISALPAGIVIQVMMYGSPNVVPMVNRWRSLDDPNRHQMPLLSTWMERYQAFLKRKTREFIAPQIKTRVRDIRVFVSMKVPPPSDQKKKGLSLDLIKRGARIMSFKDQFSEMFDTVIETKNKLVGTLQTGNFAFWNVDPNILVRMLFEVFNPKHDVAQLPRYDPSIFIKDQIVAYDTKVKVREDGFTVDGTEYATMSIKEYPPEFHLSFMGELVGDYFQNESQFPGPFLICYNAIKLDTDFHTDLKKRASLILMQKFPESIFPRLVMKQRDLKDAMEKIERAEPLISTNISIVVTGETPKEIQSATEKARSFWRQNKFVIMQDRFIGLPLMLSSMPLAYDAASEKMLSRSRLWFSDTASAFVPIEGDWKGSQTPAIPLISRRGQLVTFDLFDSGTSYNCYVIAASGSGKSVMINFITSNYLAQGSRVFILDIGRSYKKLCDIFNGQFIEFDPQRPMSMNPFSTIVSMEEFEEYLEYLISLVYFMGASKSERVSEEMEKLVKTYLEQAMTACFRQHGQSMIIDHVIAALREIGGSDRRVRDFAMQLEPYASKGRFGMFFCGKSEIEFDRNLVVVENDKLENIPELRDPVMMIVTYHISRNIQVSKRTGEYKYNLVFVDEAHKFLGNPKIDMFIEQAYRRFRKEGASMCIVTQGFNDLYVPDENGINTSRAGRVIIENSAFKFFLYQTPESIQTIRRSKQVPLSDFELELLASVRPIKGQYSEVFVATPWGNTVARLVLDRFSYHLYTTDKRDHDRLKAKVDSGLDITAAISALAEEDEAAIADARNGK